MHLFPVSLCIYLAGGSVSNVTTLVTPLILHSLFLPLLVFLGKVHGTEGPCDS